MIRVSPVSAASSDELAAACRMLSLCRPIQERESQARAYRAALVRGSIRAEGLFVARDAVGGLRGAILGQNLGGAVALVWPPGAEPGREQAAVEDHLVKSLLAWFRNSGVKVVQSLPLAGDRDGMAALERHELRLITRLATWQRELPANCEVWKPNPSLTFTCWDASSTCTNTLLATYEGSRDCPESAGDRTPVELLAGHGTVPEEPLWFLAKRGEQPIGVMLTRVESAGGELTYLGLRPECRGRGLGRELLRFAITHSVAVGFPKLSLSVDVRNEPALQLYRSHGFRMIEQRDVYNAVLTDGTDFF
jgi:mycothiol synthase